MMNNKMDDIELKISQLIDNELKDEEQKELFLILAEDQKARETLSDFMRIKKDVIRYHANTGSEPELSLPADLLNRKQEEQIQAVPQMEQQQQVISMQGIKPAMRYPRIYKSVSYISSAAAMILLMLLVWHQRNTGIHNEEYNSLRKDYARLQAGYSELQERASIQVDLQKQADLHKQNDLSKTEIAVMSHKDRTSMETDITGQDSEERKMLKGKIQESKIPGDRIPENITQKSKVPERKAPAEEKRIDNQKAPGVNSQFAYLSKAQVVEIDKKDFLIPQMWGN